MVQVRKAVNEETSLRFKSTEATTEWVQFQIAVSLKPEGSPISTTLEMWICQSAWHTLGCRLRRDWPQDHNLAEEIWNYA